MWIQYVKRFKSNNENIKEEWYGKWWNIISNNYPKAKSDEQQKSDKNLNQIQRENLITKQLKAIRAKNKEDNSNREKERKQEKERERESERMKRMENERKKFKLTANFSNDKHSTTKKILSEDELIMRDYDVEFYMSKGLTKNEAINYIKTKLTVKSLWSKMSKHHQN